MERPRKSKREWNKSLHEKFAEMYVAQRARFVVRIFMLVHSFHAYYPHRPSSSFMQLSTNYYIVIAIDIIVTTLSKLTHEKKYGDNNSNNNAEMNSLVVNTWTKEKAMKKRNNKRLHEFLVRRKKEQNLQISNANSVCFFLFNNLFPF